MKRLNFFNLVLLTLVLSVFGGLAAAEAKPTPLNDQQHFLRLLVPESEADGVKVLYKSFNSGKVESLDVFSGQVLEINLLNALDKKPPFSQLPIPFTAYKTSDTFVVDIDDVENQYKSVDLKVRSSINKYGAGTDVEMAHNSSLILVSSPNSQLQVITKSLNLQSFAASPNFRIGEDSESFVISDTLFIQIVVVKGK